MTASPNIVTRAEQPYAAIKARVTMQDLSELGARFGDVFGWLGKRGVSPAGPPFFRYNVIDMAGTLEVEAGVPIEAPADPDNVVTCAVLPSGQYATVTHVGQPQQLLEVTRSLLEWGAQQGLRWDMSPGEGGEHWGSRLEIQLSDPSEEPDMSKWRTQLAFRLADQ